MEKRFSKNVLAMSLSCALVVVVASLVGADTPKFSDWSTPENLGPIVNSAFLDQGPFISKDSLSLYFASTRPGSYGDNDFWVSQRASVDAPWEPPQNLGAIINTTARESTPTLSLDGHFLYFASSRPGGFGGLDLYVSRRHDKEDDFGWQTPVNLGSGVNSVAADLGPALFMDSETETLTLYFYSTRTRPGCPQGPGVRDIYSSTLDENGEFTPAVLVPELSTCFEDEQPAIRRDGLELYFVSDRLGGFGAGDIWVSTRASTSDPWSPPLNLGPVINTAGVEGRPALSFDGRSLYFFSDGRGGSGGTDLFVSTREKVTDAWSASVNLGPTVNSISGDALAPYDHTDKNHKAVEDPLTTKCDK